MERSKSSILKRYKVDNLISLISLFPDSKSSVKMYKFSNFLNSKFSNKFFKIF